MKWELGADPVIEEIPGFELLGPAGSGGMGRVFVALQTALSRRVAIKFLSIDPDADPNERLARFRREAGIMAALSHPNVASIHDFGEVEGQPYLVMEYLEGGDLRKRMPESGPMSPASVLAILALVGDALDYLHSRGILHRDLKPENILMHGDVPKVADFGIAVERTGSGELTRSGQGLGTLGYVAPELQYRLPVDERADQFSLAAMAYEMLTGQRPLGVFKPPSRHNPEANEAIDRVVLRALEENPADRFASVLGFIGALRIAVEGTKKPSVVRPSWFRLRWPVLVASLVLASLFGGGIWARLWWLSTVQEESDTAIARTTIQLPAWPEGSSAEIDALTRPRANAIWVSQGSPKGEAGAAVSEANWHRAQASLRVELAIIASRMWRSRVRPGPPFDAGMIEEVWKEAQKRLIEQEGITLPVRASAEGP